MTKDTLLHFSNPSELREFVYDLDVYNGWKIQSGLMNERGKTIENKSYVRKLRNIFDNKDFFRMRVSIAEIVSWLDTMCLMNRLLDRLEVEIPRNVFNQLEFSCEYMIQMSKKMRVDYVIYFKDKMLLLEFRTVNKFEKIRPTWQIKFRELLTYKELMKYYIRDKEIILYAFIAMYEHKKNHLLIKHRNYNQNQIEYLTEYIKRYLLSEN